VECYTLDHDVHAVVSNRSHTNVIFVTFTRVQQMVGAPSQPGSPDGVGLDKFIGVDRSKASEWA